MMCVGLQKSEEGEGGLTEGELEMKVRDGEGS